MFAKSSLLGFLRLTDGAFSSPQEISKNLPKENISEKLLSSFFSERR